MSEKSQILIVDDQPINQVVLTEMLSEDYDVICVDDGESCLAQVNRCIPDLILLDVNMPGLNGLQVCEILRNQKSYQDLSIIFVSALATEKERLAGYEAGGNDYVTKPFAEQELLQKIKLIIEAQKEKLSLKQSSNTVASTLMTSLSSSAELGVVIAFVRNSFTCKNMETLSKTIFDSLRCFGLEGSLLVTAFDKPQFYFSDGIDKPLERNVLSEISTQSDRIISFAQRVGFNAPKITLLIRNMPVDEDKCGRFRDHLAILIDAVAARIEGLVSEFEILSQKHQLQEIIGTVQQNLHTINEQHMQLREENACTMPDMADAMDDFFSHLGLNEEQEKSLQDLVSVTQAKTDELFEKGLIIDKQFEQILDKLNRSLKNAAP